MKDKNATGLFNAGWYTIPEFNERIPFQAEHKERQSKVWGLAPDSIQNLHVLARGELEIDDPAMVYYLRISADDYYKVYVNGIFAGQGPAPAHPSHYYYNEIPIAQWLKKGKNIIAVHAYYQGRRNRVWDSADGRFALTGEVICHTTQKISELIWKYRISEAFQGGLTGYETQFLENFDSRLWDENWSVNEHEDQSWKPMVKAWWADYRMTLQPTKMLSVYEKQPVCLETVGEGRWFLDAGEEVTGNIRLAAKGRAGQKVRILCGEELNEDGEVRFQMRCNCCFDEIWTLKDGISKLEPYDYKGFRYAMLEAEPGVELLEAVIQIRHYPMNEELCTLTTDVPLLDQIFSICKRAVKLGTQEGYLDCPTREKGQYLGDAVITARSQVWLSGSTEMLRKCIEQFAQTASVCPGLLAVTPGSFMQEIADYSLMWPLLLMTDYEFTGDREFLRQYYPTAVNLIRYFSHYRRADGLLELVDEKWNMVDWPDNLRDGYDFELTIPIGPGCHNELNALWVGAVKTVCEIGTILGIPAGFDFRELMISYQKVFYRPEKKLFADSETSEHTSLHSNVYALYYGLVPEEAKENTCDFLIEKGFSCGVMTSYFMMKALAGEGREDSVYQLMLNEGEHGWINMIRDGATTCMEAWGKDQKWNTSFCHPWASAPISILIEEIGGVKLRPETKKGYCLEPKIPSELSRFELRVPFRGDQIVIGGK